MCGVDSTYFAKFKVKKLPTLALEYEDFYVMRDFPENRDLGKVLLVGFIMGGILNEGTSCHFYYLVNMLEPSNEIKFRIGEE